MNNSEHNDLDKLLKDNLSDKGASVPGAVWDNIEAELFPKKKRRGFFWLFFFGALLTGGLATAGFFLFNRPADSSDVTTASSTKTNLHDHRHKPTATGTPANAPSSPVEAQQDLACRQTGPVALSVASGEPATNPGVSGQSSGTASLAMGESSRRNGTGNGSDRSFDGKGDKTKQRVRVVAPKGTSGDSAGEPTSAQSNGEGTKNPVSNSDTDSAIDPADANLLASVTANEPELGQPGNVDSLATMRIMPVGNGLADFLVPRKAPEKPATACGFIVYGGPSFFEMALFKDYFVSGDLSNRSFAASGMEAGIGAYLRKNRFGWYLNLGYNRKQASFQYDVAITEDDYFDYIGEDMPMPDPAATIPFENISDNGANSCFLAEDFTASYTITSWQFSLGGTMEFLRWRKFSLGGDLRFGLNLGSKLELKEWTTFSTPDYEKERFSAFRPAGGLWIWCQLSRRFAIGLTPMYSWQFQRKSSFTAGTTKELILPLAIRIGL